MADQIAAAMTSADAVTPLPRSVRVEADLRIPLSDGRHLSARLWRPDRVHGPCPALVEYAPFRHRDVTYARDALIHPWFAGHGYASLRLEPAGSGESDGVPTDEYVVREQDDCLEALSWIAAQDWCDGNTGMFGMSWGAFSALQVAARRPASLKAIIPVHGTDDRFRDDIHYMGGCLLGAGLAWGSLYQTYMMRPPDPDVAGPEWRSTWHERMEGAPDILSAWIGHHARDDYWKHGSVCEAYDAIEAATYVMCGWADGYTNAAVRMIDRLTCPHRVVIGPWGHSYPHIAAPGPRIGFLQEAVRWWDRWLKNVDNGVDREPAVCLYVQEPVAPKTSYAMREGRWIAADRWPPARASEWNLHLNGTALMPEPRIGDVRCVRTPLSNAIFGGEWLPHGVGPEMPHDQRHEDGGSMCFDTAVLGRPVEICGTPRVILKVASDTPTGTLCVRLCDVAEDGQSTLITYGLMNLTLRSSMERPEPMTPGAWFRVEVPLNAVAQIVPAGHRLRLAVSTQCWPLAWPAPDAMTLSLKTGESLLEVPVLARGTPQDAAPEFPPATIPPPADISWLREGSREHVVRHDLASGTSSRTYVKDDGAYVVAEHGMAVDARGVLTYSATGEDPLSARADYSYTLRFSRGDWSVELVTEMTIGSDEGTFRVTGTSRALEGDSEVFVRRFDNRVPRA